MPTPCKSPQVALESKSEVSSCAGTTANELALWISAGRVAGKKMPFSVCRIKKKVRKLLIANGIHSDRVKGRKKVQPVASTSAKQFSAATKVQGRKHPRKWQVPAKIGQTGELKEP